MKKYHYIKLTCNYNRKNYIIFYTTMNRWQSKVSLLKSMYQKYKYGETKYYHKAYELFDTGDTSFCRVDTMWFDSTEKASEYIDFLYGFYIDRINK